MEIFGDFPRSGFFLPLIIIAAVWEAVWKGIALWRAARNGHLVWFIFIIIINSLGILPIIYILFFSKCCPKTEPPLAQPPSGS